MPAPTGEDGLARAIAVFLMPSIGVIIAVTLTKEFYGGIAAGLVYLLLWGSILAGIYTSAKYWPLKYTASFVIAGIILWVMTPGVISEIIHPVFGAMGTLIGAVFLVGMMILLAEKAGLDDLLSD